MMYIKFILREIIFAIIALVGIFIFPIQYIFKRSIYNNPTLWKWLLLYWFSNSDEPTFEDNWYGIYELVPNNDWQIFYSYSFIRKFFLSWRWVSFRNSHYNLTLAFKPKQGEKTNIKEIAKIGDASIWTWRNKTIFGLQNVIWKVDGTKYFRYSFTRELRKYSIWRIFGFEYVNFMAGGSDNRYLVKYRLFKFT